MFTFKEFIGEGTHYKPMDRSEVIDHITGLGWRFARDERHTTYKHPNSTQTIAVPKHRGDLDIGTLKKILKQSTMMDKQKQSA